MREFTVSWIIDLAAETPQQAALKAAAMIKAPDTTATLYDVLPYGPGEDSQTIDLRDLDETPRDLVAEYHAPHQYPVYWQHNRGVHTVSYGAESIDTTDAIHAGRMYGEYVHHAATCAGLV